VEWTGWTGSTGLVRVDCKREASGLPKGMVGRGFSLFLVLFLLPRRGELENEVWGFFLLGLERIEIEGERGRGEQVFCPRWW
jgi:hypothetical protein